MAGFLISYKDSDDPNFMEFSYGSRHEGKRLLTLTKGDVLFFHTKIYKKRFITAFYVVDMVLKANDAKNDSIIKGFYNNPHLLTDSSEPNEAIVFGNTVFSKVLDNPLELTHDLLNKLSNKPNLNNKQEYQDAMTSALRTMKALNITDVEMLKKEVINCQSLSKLTDTLLLTEEVQHIKESDIQKFLVQHPKKLGNELDLIKPEYHLPSGKRIDILLQNNINGVKSVVEIKQGDIGRKDVEQLKGYMKELGSFTGDKGINGVLVCKGILPYFVEEIEKIMITNERIKIFTFAWKFSLKELESKD
ncbi:endonuclease NucS domain-containing protein [Psychrobacillus sp. NPDC096623]|uniref:endonuclease NucS domain-containing protein n=1 Tax=Psychrobacillus sp. NPDC096623 TaxID=3364492 RepID=UPI0037FC51D7